MKCTRVEKLLSQYFDRELSLQDFKNVEEHIKTCSSCRGRLDELVAMEKVLMRSENIAPSPFSFERIKVRLSEGESSSEKGWGIFRWVMAAGATAVAAGLLIFVLIHPSPPGDFEIAQNLEILQDMELIQNLDFFEYLSNEKMESEGG